MCRHHTTAISGRSQPTIPAVLFQFSLKAKFWMCAINAPVVNNLTLIYASLFVNDTAKLQNFLQTDQIKCCAHSGKVNSIHFAN